MSGWDRGVVRNPPKTEQQHYALLALRYHRMGQIEKANRLWKIALNCIK